MIAFQSKLFFGGVFLLVLTLLYSSLSPCGVQAATVTAKAGTVTVGASDKLEIKCTAASPPAGSDKCTVSAGTTVKNKSTKAAVTELTGTANIADYDITGTAVAGKGIALCVIEENCIPGKSSVFFNSNGNGGNSGSSSGTTSGLYSFSFIVGLTSIFFMLGQFYI